MYRVLKEEIWTRIPFLPFTCSISPGKLCNLLSHILLLCDIEVINAFLAALLSASRFAKYQCISCFKVSVEMLSTLSLKFLITEPEVEVRRVRGVTRSQKPRIDSKEGHLFLFACSTVTGMTSLHFLFACSTVTGVTSLHFCLRLMYTPNKFRD